MQQKLHSIFDVANQLESLSGSNAAALKRIFRITSAQAKCHVGPELSAKYLVQRDNTQHVVSVTNTFALEQTWYNHARTTKPQTFQGSAATLDPTGNGATCDFCAWQTLTAKDPGFGRIQLPHAVTGSNLFKYAEPSHGVVLFRHHDPLAFSQAALSDLLDASWLWFQESHKLRPHATAPFLLWNCLPRAGASQYHGHAQVMLSSVPVPAIDKLQRASTTYQQQHPGCCYYADLLKAHAAVGLARQVSISTSPSSSSSSSSGLPPHQQAGTHSSQLPSEPPPPPPPEQQQQQQHVAWGFASLSPVKDMEITVLGSHLCCPAFQLTLLAALRGLIEGLGCCTFNVGVLNVDLSVQPPAGVGLERVFSPSSASPTPPSSSSSSDGGSGDGRGSSGFLRCSSSSSDGLQYLYGASSSNGGSGSNGGSNGGLWLPDASYWSDKPPVVARLCSRGKLSSAASDFGGLEVWGGGSIGHTDPFTVIKQLDQQLAAAAVMCGAGHARALAN